MRYPHYLRPAAGGRWPQRVYAVDCAAAIYTGGYLMRSQYQRLLSWHCRILTLTDGDYYTSATASGITTESWWSWLSEQLTDTRCTWIVSESCARTWALLGLWTELETRRVHVIGTDPYESVDAPARTRDLRQDQRDALAPMSSGARNRSIERRQGMLVVADPPCILSARIRGAACRITWTDTRNYSCQLPETIERGALSADWLAQWWTDYHGLCTALRLGSAQCTTGSQALHGWRAGYYTGGVYAGGTAEVTDRECASYYGGRCEAFRLGEIRGPVYHLDLRSAYAAMCVEESVPTRIIRCTPNVGIHDLGVHLALNHCIASVVVSTEERAYPYRRLSRVVDSDATPSASRGTVARDGDRDIIWPIGVYSTVLCGPELADAYHHGRILQCYTLLEYDSAPVLREYARTIYQARTLYEQAGNVHMATVCKQLLVSIVGKFGQRDRRWVHCPDMWSDLLYGEWYGSDPVGRGCRYRSLGGVIQRDEMLGLCAEAIPAISAWILSAARMRLLNMIRTAGYSETYYCDTDALMVSQTGYDHLLADGLVRDNELGYLYVHGVYNTVRIHGIKHYTADGRIVCSGLPRGRCMDAGDGQHYWYSVHPGESAAHGHSPDGERVLRRYQREAEYTHGVVRRDGTVDPIVLEG